ncbi:hypothetical protein QBC44DRAFT_370367 [Cladorrhinum sp. PSN332]|nr:hypothetical protein QBC44DRAFT_370367 [Cladorrhinum sp. PSN332]
MGPLRFQQQPDRTQTPEDPENAILDTGYDPDSLFFQAGTRYDRWHWKDWVEGSSEPKDYDGHGTHLVSLIIQIAPEADIYVGRVFKSKGEITGSSGHVAQAI